MLFSEEVQRCSWLSWNLQEQISSKTASWHKELCNSKAKVDARASMGGECGEERRDPRETYLFFCSKDYLS